MIQDRDDYPELVHGYRPSWLVDIRGYKDQKHLLDVFRSARDDDFEVQSSFHLESDECSRCHGAVGACWCP